MSLLKTYGPVVHFNLIGRSYILLNDPDDIKVSTYIVYYINVIVK